MKAIYSAVIGLGLLFACQASPGDVQAAKPQFEKEWAVVAKNYPAVTRAYLKQQLTLIALFAGLNQTDRDSLDLGTLVRVTRNFCEGVRMGSQVIQVPAEYCALDLNLNGGPGLGCPSQLDRCLEDDPDDTGACYVKYTQCIHRVPTG